MEIRVSISEEGIEYAFVRQTKRGQRIVEKETKIHRAHGSPLTEDDLQGLLPMAYHDRQGGKTGNGSE